MFIDSHVHFIDYNEKDYPWMDEEMNILKKPYLPQNIEPLIESIKFDGVVVVQARQMLKETEWLLNLSKKYNLIKGVVGWVDLVSPEIEKQLEKYVVNTKFKGVRHLIHDEVDDNFMLRENFQRGISMLRKHELTYDLLIFEKHLPQTIKLVKNNQEQPFVIDHIGKPKMIEQNKFAWYQNMKVLASHENVYCKISGMVTEVDWGIWKPEDFKPYLDILFELFPADRLMIGSDWPVCSLSGNYQSVMKIVFDYIQQLSNEDKKMILGQTCTQFYNLS